MTVIGWVAIGAAVLTVLYVAFRLIKNSRIRARTDYPDIPLVVSPFPGTSAATKPETQARPELLPHPSARPPDTQLFEGRTIRFYRPPANTVKLLPGRLEVVGGDDRQEVIRFMRVPGFPAQVTLGRSEGEPLRHIQFRAPTVSRHHALLAYVDSQWVITNHSTTNPVVVNGIDLLPPRDQHVLTDGDEIEMGEVIFRYHEH